MAINNPHDRFFKESFTCLENAVDFLEETLPTDVREELDLSSLVLDTDSYVDEELAEYFSDLVYTTQSKDSIFKISILFEHKSSLVDYPHLQLLKYFQKIWEVNLKQKEKLVFVIPLIIYHGKKSWCFKKFADYFYCVKLKLQRFFPEFSYILIDLSNYSNDELKKRVFKSVFLKMSLLLMKNIYDKNELEKNLTSILEIGKLYLEEERGLKFLESAIRYLSTTELEVDKVVKLIEEVSKKGGDMAMTMATKLREEGKEEGKKEGKKEGKVEGKVEGLQEALCLGLELKYGLKGLQFFGKVNDINTLNKLKALIEAVKISQSLDELEKMI